MYGLVFEIVEDFVLEKQGRDVWHSIKEKAGCKVKDKGFLRRAYYPDEDLIAIIVAASELLDVTVPLLLETFGHYVIRHHYLNGYNDILISQGANLRQWLSNLNALHDHIEKSFPGNKFVAPIFWCEDCDEVEGSILLHYFSLRGILLVPMVVGIVEELASYQFKVAAKMTQLALQGEDGAEYTTWRITATDPSQQWKLSPRNQGATVDFSKMELPSQCPFTGTKLANSDNEKKCPFAEEQGQEVTTTSSDDIDCPVGLTLPKMQSVFPFHVLVDKEFRVLQVGQGLPSLMKRDAEDFIGTHIGEILEISRPVLGSSWDWKALRKLADQHFFLIPSSTAASALASRSTALKKKVSMQDSHIKFKASMIDISNDCVMFALSPDARNVVDLNNMGLTLSDLPLHGCQRDTVFLGEYIVQEVDKAHKLDKLSKQLESEKNLSNTLLYNMLPKSIADDLRAGKTVEPKHYDNVTLFFSDIEGFTDICAKVDPWTVIDMLNMLYSCLDHLCAKFNLYKVETIGDAYMCCSGIPFADKYHAENVANFAVAAMECVKHVKSPVDGLPLKLRIGIHSGSCTAGVVGNLTPHFCLFGDMVNATARHEQTSIAGKVQCSSDLFGRLKHFSKYEEEQFVFSPRGLVDMKGKGQCYTYWLEGGTQANDHANKSAIEALSIEVSDMLDKQTWKMRRYFRRSGALRDADAVSLSSGGTSRTASSNHTLSSRESDFDVEEPNNRPVDRSAETASMTSSDDGNSEAHDLEELDDLINEDVKAGHQDSDQNIPQGLSKLVWDENLTREDLVSNIHMLLLPILKLCLYEDSTTLPDNMDALEGQLYGFIDHLSRIFLNKNPYHNFRRAAHTVAWSEYIFEKIQDLGAGHSGSVENGPWYRLTLALAALVRDSKHTVMNGYDKRSQTKQALNQSLDVLSEDFSELYNEITWRFPRFLHLIRQIALGAVQNDNSIMTSDKKSQSPRATMEHTVVAMQQVLQMADFGHFVQGYACFSEWVEADFTEQFLAHMTKNRRRGDAGGHPKLLEPAYHSHCVCFFHDTVIPLAEQCEKLLPKSSGLRDAVIVNLKNFEADGQKWVSQTGSSSTPQKIVIAEC